MKLRWIVTAVVGVAGYFAVFGGEYSYLDLRRLEKEQKQELRDLAATRAEVARLTLHADSLEKDPVALERLARERYGLIRPGERLYRFADAPDGAASAAVPGAEPAAGAHPASATTAGTTASAPTRQP